MWSLYLLTQNTTNGMILELIPGFSSQTTALAAGAAIKAGLVGHPSATVLYAAYEVN